MYAKNVEKVLNPAMRYPVVVLFVNNYDGLLVCGGVDFYTVNLEPLSVLRENFV